MTNAAQPVTPDRDLPGQQHADVDIVVEPEPGDKLAAGESEGPGERHTPPEDPALGNTLIRPENS